MEKKLKKSIVLPALRGFMGDWAYYSCLISLREIAQRVSYADEIHKNKELSKMIQRQLNSRRTQEIASYLRTQKERFFNSLVVATYGGEPNWYALGNISNTNSEELDTLDESTVASIGFLSFRGDEKLFAIDGQHRLAGIKKAFEADALKDNKDEVSVIFLAHQTDRKGMERTRRLFTTLNKKAKPVSKGDIIALDEDDVMAVCVRWLIEETNFFPNDKLAFVATNNLNRSNNKSLTTIGNLYDVLILLFTKAKLKMPVVEKNSLQNLRPSDNDLHKYFDLSKVFFTELNNNFPALKEFFSNTNTTDIVLKYRGDHGGHILFRPAGLKIFTEIIVKLTEEMSLSDSIKLVSKLPTDLNAPPYKGLIWNSGSKRIIMANNVTLREVLLYMLGKSKFNDNILLGRYRKALDNMDTELPTIV